MMNERIDELLWQAGGYTKLSYPDDTFLDGRYALTQEQLEKFAELIVKECASICEINGSTYKYSFTPAKAMLAESTSKYCGTMIKKHFGVEE
jgi:hypothetical protein